MNMNYCVYSPVVINNVKGGKEKTIIIPQIAVYEKKFNCDEKGVPINNRILEILGIKYYSC